MLILTVFSVALGPSISYAVLSFLVLLTALPMVLSKVAATVFLNPYASLQCDSATLSSGDGV